MKVRFSFLWLLAFALLLARPACALTPEKEPVKETYTVYIFLSETCPISQFYTLALKELHFEFSGGQFAFVGIFPNAATTPETIAGFGKKYDLPFSLKPDPEQQITAALKATITPEVIIKDEAAGTIVYKGRIDDAYFRVGKRRPKVNERDLKNALTQLKNGLPVSKPETAAVGCYITLKP